jgi:hypothetical protein
MATVYLNASTGNDARTYAQAQVITTPWLTVAKCNTSATTGDTIVMAAGTYTFAPIVFAKSFTIIGAALINGMPTTILDGAAATVMWHTGPVGGTHTMSNLIFQNAVVAVNTVLIGGNDSGAGNNVSLTLNNCVIRNISVSNVSGEGGVVGFDYMSGNTLTLNNCLIYGIAAIGAGASRGSVIFLWQTGALSITANITNLTVYCSAALTPYRMVQIISGTVVVTIKNSVFYSVSAMTFSSGAGITATYSDFYNLTSPPAGTGNITTDPLFVDAANGNLNLRPTSPALDTGTLI